MAIQSHKPTSFFPIVQLFNLQEYNYFPPKFLAFCEIPQYSIVYLGVIGGGIQIGDVSRKEFGLDFSSLRFVRQIRCSCWGVLLLPFSHNKNLTNFVHIICWSPCYLRNAIMYVLNFKNCGGCATFFYLMNGMWVNKVLGGFMQAW